MKSFSLSDLLAAAGIPISTAGLVDLPPGAPEWLRWVVIVVGGVLAGVVAPFLKTVAPPVVERILAGRKAKKASLAAAKHRRAAERRLLAAALEADTNTANDVDARKLREQADHDEDEGDALAAEAAEADAISRPHRKPPPEDT